MSVALPSEAVIHDRSQNSPEVYSYVSPDRVRRTVQLRTGKTSSTSIRLEVAVRKTGDAYADYWQMWLRSRPSPSRRPRQEIRVADLFSGCGGLSVGIEEACRAVGAAHVTALAVDTEATFLEVFEDNFAPEYSHCGGIEDLIDNDLGAKLSARERKLKERIGEIAIAIGGPPCQGHSDLNNHTRRRDPKNALYLRMARFVDVIRPKLAIIENVPGVIHDSNGVVQTTHAYLEKIGYQVSMGVIGVDQIGWAQRRKRHVLIASLGEAEISVENIRLSYKRDPLPVTWAIGDNPQGTSVLESSAQHSSINRERIAYLFGNDLYELPDEMRPDCHRLKPHSYKSVYGRMKPFDPAPTITSGFGSTGQGRFVHPFQERTLTPREAARVQGFPDWFSFEAAETRGSLQQMIGNAVPSRLAYVAALEGLR
jgi:DNA (cytosine-5)-methyltransferase 1